MRALHVKLLLKVCREPAITLEGLTQDFENDRAILTSGVNYLARKGLILKLPGLKTEGSKSSYHFKATKLGEETVALYNLKRLTESAG